ncbi:MAG TPA: malto-oligosyltrehalose synthase [Acidimicrobiales bacterium]|jgi:(1->4)-alpha-D-glucan 1-alpha-D-glucosylmutase|nr:malto-oligosyltrehalose synthase [Acidimicrobiales bacterium]
MTRPLIGTYRLQLRPDFGFDEATAIVPYLARLGVSHVYLAPCFEATPGSTHGYDVVDPNSVRGELGGRPAFDRLVRAARGAGLGVVLDIVPHHMAATAANAWWWSVLELGRDSPYASHFDIDWDPPERRLRGSVLLPVLGDHYGRVLEGGELKLSRDGDRLVVRYHEHTAPLSPDTADELWAIAGRRGSGIDPVLDDVNADIDRLDALLDRQHHRFARWQAAAHELDYRRFFDIDSLVALRSERPAVFEETHRLTHALVADGSVDGLRIDHLDGLRDPQEYLERLRKLAPDAWIVAEKILQPGESTPLTWPIDGTTGYDFLAGAAGLLVDAGGVDALVRAYEEFTGDAETYAEARLGARREALRESLDADLERVVSLLVRVCERNRRWRDFTRSELRDALAEVCVHGPAYRSYVVHGVEPSDADRAFVGRSIAGARATRPDLDPDLLDLIGQLLLGDFHGEDETGLVARFQQLTGPVAAKGEEDTAFYRWTPLLCLNEVGTEPDRPTMTVAAFHERAEEQQHHWPLTMLTTSTHDTKRSEDVRARLAVLSELPAEWVATVHEWSTANDRHRDLSLDAPDRRDEWFIYQTLVGGHPLPLDRAWTVIEKSLREAKRRTSWTRVSADYEQATRRFVESILADADFRAELERLDAAIADAGYVNALTQLALRLFSPGVPDTYQGTELWDSSLVDPDNRRAVDFDARSRALDTVRSTPAAELWRRHRAAGLPKLALLHAGLTLRRRRPDAVGRDGGYESIAVRGESEDRVVAFTRGDEIGVVAPRLPLHGLADDAVIGLPAGAWRNVLNGEVVAGDVAFGRLRADFPVALLERDLDPVR